MNDSAFEDALRSTLRAAAPLEVPVRLEDRARAIPGLVRPRQPWWRSIEPRMRISVAAIVAALVVIVAVALVVQRSNLGPAGGGPPNPVLIQSAFGSLIASDLELTVGGRVFRVPSSAGQPGVRTLTLAGSSTYGRLTILWHAGSTPLTMVMHFAADAHTWWVSEIVATDGRPEQAGWLYFEGPFFERPLGNAFTGSIELSSVRSTYGETGSLQFGELSLSAFAPGSPRNPTLGTMPPQDGASAFVGAPDFIPFVGTTGNQIIGYVPTAELDQPVPIGSFRGQSPDQPVYGPDLKTLIGYSVAGKGFEPLASTGSSPSTLAPSVASSPTGAANTAGGLTWQTVSITGSNLVEIHTVVGLPDGYLAVGQAIGNPTRVSLWRSTDAISWNELPNSPAFSERQSGWYDSVARVIEISPAHLLAVGSADNGDASAFNAAAWTSSDAGLTWQRAAVADAADAADAAMSDVAPTSNGFVVVGVDGHPSGGTQLIGIRGAAVWTSSDGTHWARTPTQPAFAGAQMDHVTAADSVVVAPGLDVPTGSGSVAPPRSGARPTA
jgi:hypothetical protein